MALRVAFFGTPAFSVPTLDRLLASQHDVVGVVTQPDRPRGRGQRITESPVKRRAVAAALPVLQPERMRDELFLAALRAWRPDLGVVAAYGRILTQQLLELPRLGMVNVHASLLPRWRGAAPVHRAILAGDHETGVTIMRVVQALDAGPMLARATTPIAAEETSVALELRLASMGADLLVPAIDALEHGEAREQTQDEQLVTYAARLDRADGPVDWRRPALEIHDQIRGLHPWPLASSAMAGRRIILLESEMADETHPADPGTVVAIEPRGLLVAAGGGTVRITRVQLEGRAPVAVKDFLNGHAVRPGDRFETVPRPV